MSNTELNETLVAIGRNPDTFRRDTAQFFMILDNLELFNRRIKDMGRKPERRIEGVK